MSGKADRLTHDKTAAAAVVVDFEFTVASHSESSIDFRQSFTQYYSIDHLASNFGIL